jgi:chorismate mutase
MAGGRPPGDEPVPEGIAEDLDRYRRRIDELDAQLVRLLNERATCANEIGRLKEQVSMEVYQPGRERTVLDHVRSINEGPLADVAVIRLFERIIDESRRLERLREGRPPGKGQGSAP